MFLGLSRYEKESYSFYSSHLTKVVLEASFCCSNTFVTMIWWSFSTKFSFPWFFLTEILSCWSIFSCWFKSSSSWLPCKCFWSAVCSCPSISSGWIIFSSWFMAVLSLSIIMLADIAKALVAATTIVVATTRRGRTRPPTEVRGRALS